MMVKTPRRCDYSHVVDLYRSGLNLSEVGMKVGISAPTVRNILINKDIPRRGKNITVKSSNYTATPVKMGKYTELNRRLKALEGVA